MERGERCLACGRPTYAGEDFDGPCVEDTDLACALALLSRERTWVAHMGQMVSKVGEMLDDAERAAQVAFDRGAGWMRERCAEEVLRQMGTSFASALVKDIRDLPRGRGGAQQQQQTK